MKLTELLNEGASLSAIAALSGGAMQGAWPNDEDAKKVIAHVANQLKFPKSALKREDFGISTSTRRSAYFVLKLAPKKGVTQDPTDLHNSMIIGVMAQALKGAFEKELGEKVKVKDNGHDGEYSRPNTYAHSWTVYPLEQE